jgi:hypothetical protein
MRFSADGNGTKLDYRIRFEIPWYCGGRLVGALIGRVLRREITAGLARFADQLRAGG